MTRLLVIAAMALVGCKTFDAGQYAPDPGTAEETQELFGRANFLEEKRHVASSC